MKITFRADEVVQADLATIMDFLAVPGVKITTSDAIRYAIKLQAIVLRYQKLSSYSTVIGSSDNSKKVEE